MDTMEKAQRLDQIQAYLAGIGQPISRIQAHEVMARAHGFRNKHTFAASRRKAENAASGVTNHVYCDSVRVEVMAQTSAPLTVAQMQARAWRFDVVVPVHLDLFGDVEALNNHVSEFITGEACALEDIGYSHVPQVTYSKSWVAMRVTGYVSRPEDFFDIPE